MSKFIESELGPLLDIIIDYRGKTPKKLRGEWVSSGIPALSAKNIKHGKIVNPGSIRYVNNDLYSRWMKEEVKKGDILMTSEAPLGETFYIKNNNKILLSQRLFAIRTNREKLDSGFLFYYFNSKFGNHELLSRATGTTVGGIRQTALVKVVVRYPENITKQKQISSVICTYDDLIENNEKRIKILEEMAQLLYTEWFVKFKFPGHEKVNMVDSSTEHSMVPEGWEVKKLKDISNIISGYAFKSSDFQETGIPVIKIKNITSNNTVDTNSTDFISPVIVTNRLSKYFLKDGDMVIAMTGATAGKVGRISTNQRMLLNQRVAKIDPNSGWYSFVWGRIETEEAKEELYRLAGGAAQPNMSSGQIEGISLLVPPEKVVIEYEKLVSFMLNEILLLQKYNYNLSQTRDLLIPQLVTGKRELK